MSQVAILTGGGSGIGLAVAHALAEQQNWKIYILDCKFDQGVKLPNSTLHQVDVRVYEDLAHVFQIIFEENHRLDFVFANAGVLGPENLYDKYPTNQSPPKPELNGIDVTLKGVVYTSFLALHYFRQTVTDSRRNLVITGSCFSFYPSFDSIYTACKHAVIGYVRSIAPSYLREGIHVNSLCFGPVRTNLTVDEQWDKIPARYFIPMEKVTDLMIQVLKGQDMVDSKGRNISGSALSGRAIEVSGGGSFYFEEHKDWADELMRQTMLETWLAP